LIGGELHDSSGRTATYRQPGLSHKP
jgi:hypothetical protein